uniref:3-isopropylmalate dehydrogenase n=1 Tax=Buchnera aphidicola subsp. Tetraneura caerulescens TaxID=118111 RepID=Q6UA44_BUCTC|nr:3-isopropylmalate dehydrogenase [Buchnera aphidicola (Tetraneura caerulescens)]
MIKKFKLAILAGDGIGPEVMEEGIKILEVIKKKFMLKLDIKEYLVGGVAIDKFGTALPKSTIDGCLNADAVLFGSVGGDKWKHLPVEQQPERAALLPLRKILNLFVNIRSSKLYSSLSHLSPLKSKIVNNGFDILCVRELIGGIYYGIPKGQKMDNYKRRYAVDTSIYYEEEITRIANFAFEIATFRRKKVTSVDKANVLETSILWREVVNKVAKKYPEISLNHLYVDNASMQIIKNPMDFDVILCPNLFGDILSDECGMITGSIGMLPSASLNKSKFGLYEPAGGSAPDISGKNIANPIALILSISMLFKYSFEQLNIADAIESSVINVLKDGYRTFDILTTNTNEKLLSTSSMGSKISDYLKHEE